jgi:hypothetical protein
MIERDQPLAAAPPLIGSLLPKLLAPALRHRFRAHEPIKKRPSSRVAASDLESAMSKNRFLSSSDLASRAIRKNSFRDVAMIFGGSH